MRCGKHLPSDIKNQKSRYCNDCLKKISLLKIERFLKDSGIRGILNEMTFDSFDVKLRRSAYKTAKEYAENFDMDTVNGLMFFGSAGSGKTHLAVAIAKYLIEQKEIPVIFTRVIDLLQEIRGTYNSNENYRVGNEVDLIKKYTKIPLLVLDDLGAEKITDWVKQILYQVIDERLIERKPIIITSNLSLDELEVKLDERTASRINSICPQQFEMKDPDYRIKTS